MGLTLEEKRAAVIEILDERTKRLSEWFEDFKRDHKADRAILSEIQGTLRQMQGEGLTTKVDKLETRCFGDHDNSLDSRVRAQENWHFKVIGMGIAAGAVASVVVSLVIILVSKRL